MQHQFLFHCRFAAILYRNGAVTAKVLIGAAGLEAAQFEATVQAAAFAEGQTVIQGMLGFTHMLAFYIL